MINQALLAWVWQNKGKVRVTEVPGLGEIRTGNFLCQRQLVLADTGLLSVAVKPIWAGSYWEQPKSRVGGCSPRPGQVDTLSPASLTGLNKGGGICETVTGLTQVRGKEVVDSTVHTPVPPQVREAGGNQPGIRHLPECQKGGSVLPVDRGLEVLSVWSQLG